MSSHVLIRKHGYKITMLGSKYMHIFTLYIVQSLLPGIFQLILFFYVLTDSVFSVSVTVNLNNTACLQSATSS